MKTEILDEILRAAHLAHAAKLDNRAAITPVIYRYARDLVYNNYRSYTQKELLSFLGGSENGRIYKKIIKSKLF